MLLAGLASSAGAAEDEARQLGWRTGLILMALWGLLRDVLHWAD